MILGLKTPTIIFETKINTSTEIWLIYQVYISFVSKPKQQFRYQSKNIVLSHNRLCFV